ncbi:MAG: hypothetical protein CVU36_19585 [Betaproteobacteria bacterium HGW-Betaproteobacteria-9]|jgi:hypothetical protein|nr:MAG: hypothetical protein CVU36_19585 [Betaproteobacteria bacterium HGW-Betaproteobacteria-9]
MDATVLKRWWHGLLAMGLLVLLTGCASGPKLVPHAFSFNGLNDQWADSVDLLAYAYGDGYHMVREDLDQPSSSLYAGKTSLPPGTGVNGPMPVGEFLLVKWRVKTTGEVVEERVDLRDRLPRDMTDHELTFVIDGRQLYVYVVTPRRKKSFNEPPILKTWRSEFAHAYEIFPAMRKP